MNNKNESCAVCKHRYEYVHYCMHCMRNMNRSDYFELEAPTEYYVRWADTQVKIEQCDNFSAALKYIKELADIDKELEKHQDYEIYECDADDYKHGKTTFYYKDGVDTIVL